MTEQTTYRIDSAHGDEIACGMTQEQAMRRAQEIADRTGQTVYVAEDMSGAPAVEVAPSAHRRHYRAAADPRQRTNGEARMTQQEWTFPYHGVQHLGNAGHRNRWCTVEDFGSFARLTRWWPGCGFAADNQSDHATAAEARAEGERWLAEVPA